MLLVASCVETEESELPPHVNLTPPESDGDRLETEELGGGDLGLEVRTNESDSLERLEVLPGVRVAAVSRGGPADAAGLEVGDVILSVDGAATDLPDAFEALVRSTRPGGTLVLEVRRGTRVREHRLEARRRLAAVEATPLYHADPLRARAGFRPRVLERDPPRLGAEVVRFFPKSPLPDAGVREGDIVVALDGRAIGSARDLVRRLIEERDFGDTVELGLLRDGAEESVEVTLWEPSRRVTRLAVPLAFTYEASVREDRTEFTLLDLWLLSLFAYRREGAETEYSILTFFRFGTGYGELVDEADLAAR